MGIDEVTFAMLKYGIILTMCFCLVMLFPASLFKGWLKQTIERLAALSIVMAAIGGGYQTALYIAN